MSKGGYKVINLKNVNLSATTEGGVTISGIYSSIEGSYRKPLLFSGLVIEGAEKNDTFSEAIAGDNVFTVSVYGKTITISNTDNVTIA